jgi:hypothetical protein
MRLRRGRLAFGQIQRRIWVSSRRLMLQLLLLLRLAWRRCLLLFLLQLHGTLAGRRRGRRSAVVGPHGCWHDLM